MDDSREIATGTVFAGRYHVKRCIARGGMGAIYEVIHLETQRHRALKVILPAVLSRDLQERFRQEARVAAQVQSEHIVDVFDAGVDEQTQMPFLVMELLEGEELGKRLDRVGKFPPAEALTYLFQTALALDKTHAANIVHRDLKPENLFLTFRDDGQPRIKILDFGIAKVIADGATRSGATRNLGTPLYMAPEQFLPGGQVSPQSDIYSLAIVAYALLVGQPYFYEEAERDGNMFAFAASVTMGPQEPATVRARRQGVTLPPAFDAWFVKCTAKDPKARPSRATQAISELANIFNIASPIVASNWQSGPQGSLATGPSIGSSTPVAVGQQSTPMQLAVSSKQSSNSSRTGLVVAVALVALVALGGIGFFLAKSDSSSNNGPVATSSASTVPAATNSTPPPVVSPVAIDTVAPTASAAVTAMAPLPKPTNLTTPAVKPSSTKPATTTTAKSTSVWDRP